MVGADEVVPVLESMGREECVEWVVGIDFRSYEGHWKAVGEGGWAKRIGETCFGFAG